MTDKLYLADPATLSGTTVVTALSDGDRPSIRLRETWFHPQGGGQRGDRGRIGPAQVLDTRHAGDGEVDHFVDSIAGLSVGDRVEIAVDGDFRRRSAVLHSAGHFLADVVPMVAPQLRAVGGHHWDGEARVEFECSERPEEGFETAVAAKLAELIAADLPIAQVGDPFSARAIQVGSFAPVGCGGTHVASTAALAGLAITGTKMKGTRFRVSYSC